MLKESDVPVTRDRDWERVVRRYAIGHYATLGLLLAGFWWVAVPGRLGAWTGQPAFEAWPVTVRVCCILVPWFAGAAVRRAAYARLESALLGGGPGGSRHGRATAFTVLALVATLAPMDLLQAIPPLRRGIEMFPTLAAAGLLVVAIPVALAFFPLLLRVLWATRPLPPGPLRDRLEGVCRRAGVRCRELRLWDAGSPRVVTAAVAGDLPGWRTVFLTVPLLRDVPAAERDAVLAHEIAHVRRHHLAIYAILVAALAAWLAAGHDAAARAFGPLTPAYTVTLLALAAAFVRGWFGVVSRRFERQADLDGAALVGAPEAMASALERAARMAEQPVTRRQWRHGSIASRLTAVRGAAADPAVGARFERQARWAAWSAPALLAVGALGLVPVVRVEVATGCLRAAAQRGDAAAAAAWYDTARRVREPGAWVHLSWGDACESLGRAADAIEAYRRAMAARDCTTDQRRALARRLEELGRKAGLRSR